MIYAEKKVGDILMRMKHRGICATLAMVFCRKKLYPMRRATRPSHAHDSCREAAFIAFWIAGVQPQIFGTIDNNQSSKLRWEFSSIMTCRRINLYVSTPIARNVITFLQVLVAVDSYCTPSNIKVREHKLGVLRALFLIQRCG